MATLEKNNITDYDHGARQVRNSDFTDFDYVFAMDSSNLRNLKSLQKRVDDKGTKTTAKVMLFGEYSGSGKVEEVGDR